MLNPELELRPHREADATGCAELIASLPQWFGLPDANAAYLRNLAALPSWVIVDGDAVLGALTLETTSPEAVEIRFMAVRPEQHRRGLGRELVEHAERVARAQDARWLHVKTLGPSHPDEGYARTRAFYIAMGFERLFESPTIWGRGNPALILVKRLQAP